MPRFLGTPVIPTGAVAGYVASSDASGAVSWSTETPNVEIPLDIGLLYTTIRFSEIGGVGPLGTTLVPYVKRFVCPKNQTVANVYVSISVAGSTLTSGSNRIGLYNAAGTKIGETADMSTTWNSAGWKAMTLTVIGGQSLALTANAVYYLAYLASATTRPAVSRGNSFANVQDANGLNTGAALNWSTLAAVVSGSGLPTSFTPASGLTASAIAIPYVGLN